MTQKEARGGNAGKRKEENQVPTVSHFPNENVNNLGAELAFLGCALQDATADDTGLSLDQFESARVRTTLAEIRRQVSEGHTPDLGTVAAGLAARGELDHVGGASWLAECTSFALPGQAAFYAAQVRRAAKGRNIRGDIASASEWLRAGDDPDRLLSDLRRDLERFERDNIARVRIIAAEEIRTTDMPPRRWFVDQMMTVGMTLLTAKKGIGKSFFVLQLSYCVASGTAFLDRSTSRGRVLYVVTELDETAVHERLNLHGVAPIDLFVAYGWRNGYEGLADAEAVITAHKIDVLIIDMFSGVLPAGSETNSYDLTPFLLAWRQMAHRLGVAVVAVWHSAKADREDPMLAALGTTALAGQADCYLALDRKRDAMATKLFIGGNHGREHFLNLWFEDRLWKLADGSDAAEECAPADRPILDFLRNGRRKTAPEIAAIIGKSPDAIRAALSRLRVARLVDKDGREWFATDTIQELDDENNPF